MNVRSVFLAASLTACSEPSDPPQIFVGTAKQTFVAVVVDADCANAYVTDGREGWASVWSWMETAPGSAFGGEGPLWFSKDGITLTLSLDELKGTLNLPTSMSDFDVERIDEPAGVYIASATTGGTRYLGAWIFTSTGEQRGAVLVGTTLLPSLLSGPEQAQMPLKDGVLLNVRRVTVPACKTATGTSSGGGVSSGGGGDGGEGGGVCCKTCGANSKPCGDSCIALDKTCHQTYGCACDG